MRQIYKNARLYRDGRLELMDLEVNQGRIVRIEPGLQGENSDQVFPISNYIIIPGFTDVHVHLREPGFFYKESIQTGTRSAARGGYTDVCCMPNLDPPPDNPEHLAQLQSIIDKTACVHVFPYATLTVGRKGRGVPADYKTLTGAIAFSDDGTGIQDEALMEQCMLGVKAVGGIICAHCEDETLLDGGYIHEGEYAKAHGHKGISSESEYAQIERDLALAKKTGCRYHVCHISTKQSVDLIRRAKAEGVDVTCETAPHYLTMCDADLQEHGRFKMNPPIRSEEDKQALIEGLKDGTIDMIATDHAPHSAEEKDKGLAGSAMGIVGLETAFGVLNTHLVETGILTMEQLLYKMCDAPRKRFSIPGGLAVGNSADFAVLDIEKIYTIDANTFLSKGRSTPFDGWRVRGQCVKTVIGGRSVYDAL